VTSANFQFDSSQEFQLAAIESVINLFEGQPKDSKGMTTLSGSVSSGAGSELLDFARTFEVGAVGNHLVVGDDLILDNLQAVQDANGLEVAAKLAGDSLEFDI